MENKDKKIILNMKNISYLIDGEYILKNINWQVRRGEHWAIIGLNGSGKTSLLNVVTGYAWPSRGEVSVLGRKFGSFDIRKIRKSIGWASSYLQERLYGSETGLEIVASGKFATIGLYDKTAKKDITRANALLKQFGCSHLAARQYSIFSQGEKQKVLIARALMGSPKVLILDEPCEGLDIFAREQLLSIISGFSKRENSPLMLYVSHRIEEVLPVFTHAMLLKNGSVFLAGKTKDVLTNSSLTKFFGEKIKIIWSGRRPSLSIAAG